MYKEYKLSHFFLFVCLFVLCIVGWIAYAHRTNAPANLTIIEEGKDKDEVKSSFFNTDERSDTRDVSSPFYTTIDKNGVQENEGWGVENKEGEEKNGEKEEPHAVTPAAAGVKSPASDVKDSDTGSVKEDEKKGIEEKKANNDGK